MALLSTAGGLVEAAFLVAIARIAVAVADGSTTISLPSDRTVGISSAVAISVGLVVVRAAFAVLAARLTSSMVAVLINEQRVELSRAYVQAGWPAQQEAEAGRLQELMTTTVQRASGLLTGISMVLTAGCTLFALIVSALLVDPASTGFLLIAIAILGAALRPLRKAIRRQARATSATTMDVATGIGEVAPLGLEANVYGVQASMIERLRRVLDADRAATEKLAFLRAVGPVSYAALGYLAVCGALWAVYRLGGNAVAAAGPVLLLMLRSLSYGQALQTGIMNIQASLPFVERLEVELEHYRQAVPLPGLVSKNAVGDLSFRRVNFEYRADTPVLRDVSFSIKGGEIVGVVGPSGSGKSTLIQILLRLREPTSGEYLVDSVRASDIARDSWSHLVSFVPQTPRLFSGSISDNIRFFRQGISDDAVVKAAALAGLESDIARLPGGYEFQVGDQGSRLSGGQQQRLVIARALAVTPCLLVLDEPTSALDANSERFVRATLESLRGTTTVVVIAHRMSTVENCDRIMVIEEGRLAAFDRPGNVELTSEFFSDSLRLSGMRGSTDSPSTDSPGDAASRT